MARTNLELPHLVLDALSDNPEAQRACLSALKDVQDGEGKLSGGDYTGAVEDFLKAHALFSRIPQARALLGNVKTKLAAGYGYLDQQEKCLDYAKDALSIIAGAPRMEYTEACARMTLGTALWRLGNEHQGKIEYNKARIIFSRLPGAEAELAGLDQNKRSLMALRIRYKTPSHLIKFISVVLLVIIAILYVAIRGCS